MYAQVVGINIDSMSAYTCSITPYLLLNDVVAYSGIATERAVSWRRSFKPRATQHLLQIIVFSRAFGVTVARSRGDCGGRWGSWVCFPAWSNLKGYSLRCVVRVRKGIRRGEKKRTGFQTEMRINLLRRGPELNSQNDSLCFFFLLTLLTP